MLAQAISFLANVSCLQQTGGEASVEADHDAEGAGGIKTGFARGRQGREGDRDIANADGCQRDAEVKEPLLLALALISHLPRYPSHAKLYRSIAH